MDARPLPCLMGPTGVGKTDLAIALSQYGPFEIISVDSGMVYRGLDIGTAKPTPSVLARVPHHLIDLCDPTEHYSAARFRRDALAVIAAIRARGRVPLLVGGTGLYFRALLHGLSPLPQSDPTHRARLEQELSLQGSAALHGRLREIDPDAAARIHPNDPQRILRALEVHELTGIPLSAQQRRQEQALPCLRIALVPRDRGELHSRVAARFRRMIARGLINEVRALRERYGFDAVLPGLKLVGYREIDAYVAGACDATEAERRAITATRQLVRRQLTWLRGEDSVEWFYSDNMSLTEQLLDVLRQRGVIS